MTARSYTLESLSSNELLYLSLIAGEKRKVIDHLDYSSFSNFITLGSAEFEVNLAISQILNNYPTFEKFGISSNNLSITTNDEIVSEYLSWKFNSEPFAEHLSQNIANQTISATITGALYSSNSSNIYSITFPYFDRNQTSKQYYFNDSTVITNINSWTTSASEYDKYNMNMICNFLPDVMTLQDDDFDTLIRAIGKQLDLLYYSTKDMNSIYANEYNIEKIPNDIILDQFINSIGFDKLYSFIDKNIIDYYQPIHGSIYSRKDLSRYFKASFINNIMDVIKKKGTKESINVLKNIFAWPENLIEIKEYVTVSDKIPSSGFVYHTWNYDTLVVPKKGVFSSSKFRVAPTDYVGVNHPNLIVIHFKYPSFFDLKNGTLNGSISDLELITFTYNSELNEIKFKIDATKKSFGFSGSADLFPLSSSVFDYVTENSVFTLGYDPINKLAYLGYYDESSSYKYNSSSSNNVGFVRSITAKYDSNMTSKNFSSLILDYHNEPIFEKNFYILGVKTYNKNIDINSISSLTMNYNLINYDGLYPTHWWKKQNVKSRGLAITEYVDNISGENAISLASPASSELEIITVMKAEEIKFSSGEMIDPIGIYVDDENNNISNYMLANNKLKIEISPINIINQFIKNLVNVYNFDEVYGNPDDLYKNSYSKLKEFREAVYLFLSNYSQDIDIQSFFNILKTQYSENIIKFIIEYLIPAKSNVEGGIVVENDILDDNKYAWKKPVCDEINKEDSVKEEITTRSSILDENCQINNLLFGESESLDINSNKFIDVIKKSEDLLSQSNTINNIGLVSETKDESVDFLKSITEISNIINIEESNIDNISKNMDTLNYEDRYISLGKWSLNNAQGDENDSNGIVGLFKFGTSQINKKSILENVVDEKIAHSDSSILNISWNKEELDDINSYGTLNLSLTRFGNETPNGIIKLIVPSRTESDDEPIIYFSNINSISGDCGYPSLSSSKEIFIKLNKSGFRTINYNLNIPTLPTSSVQNAYSTINFGNLGPSAVNISMEINANSLYEGDAGNIISFIIEENPNMHSSYSKCEILKNKTIKLSVVEVPYVVYNIIDALTSNLELNNYVSLNLSDLYLARGSSTSDSEWMSKTVGEFRLQNGSGSMSTIKNKNYKIQALNIYNNEQKEFSITPRIHTIAIDENELIKETT